MTEEDVRALLRKRIDELKGRTAFSRRYCVSPSYLRDVLNGDRVPGPAILAPLGLRRVEAEARYEEAVRD